MLFWTVINVPPHPKNNHTGKTTGKLTVKITAKYPGKQRNTVILYSIYTVIMSNNILSGKTYKDLRELYGVTHATFTIWLDLIPGLDHKKGQRKFTPAQLDKILNHLGEP